MKGSVYKNVMVRGVNGIASLERVSSVGQNADLVPFANFAHDIIFLSITKKGDLEEVHIKLSLYEPKKLVQLSWKKVGEKPEPLWAPTK